MVSGQFPNWPTTAPRDRIDVTGSLAARDTAAW